MGRETNIHANLVKRCKNGDSRAQYKLYRYYSRAMYNTAMRFFNNTMDAEDILQESFITAFKKINTLDNENSFGSWLKRIVVNKSISELRKRKVYFEAINEEIATTVASDVDNDISPQVVNNAVKNLPDDARIIVNLFAFEGYKHKEIAVMLDITESLSKIRYKRAKEHLEKEIKKVMDYE